MNEFKIKNGLIVNEGGAQITGSLYAPSITGSIFGTASFAESSNTSSFTLTASYLQGTITSASFALTASFLQGSISSASFAQDARSASFAQDARTSSFALTASFLQGSITSASFASTASFVASAQSSSVALIANTASFYNENDPVFNRNSSSLATTSSNIFIGNQILTGSLQVSGSSGSRFVSPLTASIISSSLGFTGSLFGTASFAVSSSNTLSSSFSEQARSASYSISSSVALIANTASFVTLAQSASFANNAFASRGSGSFTGSFSGSIDSASFAEQSRSGSFSQLARSASYSDFNRSSSFSELARSASYSDLSRTASFANNAFASRGSGSFTGSFSGSINSASFAQDARSSSFTELSRTSSYALTASYLQGNVISASYAVTTSFSNNLIISGNINQNASTASFGGLVGIGTTNPLGKLHLYSNVSGATRFIIDSSESYPRIISFRTSGSARWAFRVDGDETGGNAGGHLHIRRYDDTGSFNGTPISLLRENGFVGINKITPTAQLDISGSSLITGSLEVSLGVTSSLFGTASFAVSSSVTHRATSASYVRNAETASYYNGSVISASFAELSRTASFALTASFLQGSITSASYALTASSVQGAIESASFASTASFVNILRQAVIITGSIDISGSNGETNILDDTEFIGPVTASIISSSLGFTGSLFGVASSAITSSYALTASFAQNATSSITSSYALTASYLQGSIESASFAQDARTASFAELSRTASFALTASFLQGSITSASFASTASYLQGSIESASFAQDARTASFAELSRTASFTLTASFLQGSVTSASYALTSSYTQNSFAGIRTITSSYALTSSDENYLFYVSSSANIILYLPDSFKEGWNTTLIKSGSGNINISASSNIDATDNTIYTQNTATNVVHKGNNKWSAFGALGSSSVSYRLELGVKSGDDATAVTTGSKGLKSVDFGGTMTEWTLVSNIATTSSVSVWKAAKQIPTTANSILTASLAGQSINSGSVSISVAEGDIFQLEVKTNTTSSYLFLEMKVIQ